MTSSTIQRAAGGLILLATLPVVSARECFFRDNGEEVCSGLPIGARIGIAFGVFFLIMLLFAALGASRRRRMRRTNQAYISDANATQTYPAPGYNYNQNGYDPANAGGQVPQYPPPVHASYDQYNGAPAYHAQPYSQPGSPPQYPTYAPPPGTPPTHKE